MADIFMRTLQIVRDVGRSMRFCGEAMIPVSFLDPDGCFLELNERPAPGSPA